MGNNSNNIKFQKEPFILIILALILLNIPIYSFRGIHFCYLLIPIFIFVLINISTLLDNNFLFIFIFSFFYFSILQIFGYDVGSISILFGYLIFPSVFYLLGKYLIYKYPSEFTVYFLIFFMSFLFSILPFIANLRSVFENGFMAQRSIRLLWMERGEVRAATGIGGYFASNLSLFPLIFIQRMSKIEKKLMIFSVFLFVIALFSIVNMSNRTGLTITIISIFISLYLLRRSTSVLLMTFFLMILVILYLIDAWNIRTWFENSLYFYRISQTAINEEGSRFLIWRNSIIRLINNPFGSYKVDFEYFIGSSYAHNLWLDVGLRTGIITLIPLFIFTISGIECILKIINNKSCLIFLKVLIVGVGISFYITFLVEPAIEGFIIMFFMYCFYLGIINGISRYILT